MLRHAAALGVGTAGLTSSPTGEPVYRRLGFRAVAEYQVFTFCARPTDAASTGHATERVPGPVHHGSGAGMSGLNRSPVTAV